MAIGDASSSRPEAADDGQSQAVEGANLSLAPEQEQEEAPAIDGIADANLPPAREPEQQEAPARDGVADANLLPAPEPEQQEAPAGEGVADVNLLPAPEPEQLPQQEPEAEMDLMSGLLEKRSPGKVWPRLDEPSVEPHQIAAPRHNCSMAKLLP